MKFLVGAASIGYPMSVREVRAIVSAIMAKKMGVELFEVSQGWWEKFRHRHPELSLRRSEPLAFSQAVSLTREVVDIYSFGVGTGREQSPLKARLNFQL